MSVTPITRLGAGRSQVQILSPRLKPPRCGEVHRGVWWVHCLPGVAGLFGLARANGAARGGSPESAPNWPLCHECVPRRRRGTQPPRRAARHHRHAAQCTRGAATPAPPAPRLSSAARGAPLPAQRRGVGLWDPACAAPARWVGVRWRDPALESKAARLVRAACEVGLSWVYARSTTRRGSLLVPAGAGPV